MAEIKLLRLEYGDSQKNVTDKLNYNFSRIFLFGGGPYGRAGSKGPDGPIGNRGPVGSYGDMGTRGTKWTVGPSQPSPLSSINGDQWMNTSSSNSLSYYQSGNWVDYGFGVSSSDLFDVFGPLSTSTGISSRSGYFISSGTPIGYTFVMSDLDNLGGGVQGNPNIVANPQYSKMVIAINGSDVTKNILEFSKTNYLSDPSFLSNTPKFSWDHGATADRGTYGLRFTAGEGMLFNMPTSNLSVVSGPENIIFNSIGFNVSVNSAAAYKSSSSAEGSMSIDVGTGSLIFSTKNISYASGQFALSTRFSVATTGSDPKVPLDISSTSTTAGNLRYFYGAISNNSAILFSANQVTPTFANLFSVYGDGLVYFNKRVNSIQNQQTITQTVSSSVGGTTVNWSTIVPSIAMNTSGSDYYFSNNGIDYIIDKSGSAAAGERGICVWAPATGGSVGNNGGWLNLVDSNEAISFRVHSSKPSTDTFRYIGLNTSNLPNVAPNNTVSANYSYVDLGSGLGASTVDFTIINVTGAGGTGSDRRWFKVYYSAWGGNLLSGIQCGTLSTYGATYGSACAIPTLVNVVRSGLSLTFSWLLNAVDSGAGTVMCQYSTDGGITWIIAVYGNPNIGTATSGTISLTIGTPIKYRCISYYTVAGTFSCNDQISNIITTTF